MDPASWWHRIQGLGLCPAWHTPLSKAHVHLSPADAVHAALQGFLPVGQSHSCPPSYSCRHPQTPLPGPHPPFSSVPDGQQNNRPHTCRLQSFSQGTRYHTRDLCSTTRPARCPPLFLCSDSPAEGGRGGGPASLLPGGRAAVAGLGDFLCVSRWQSASGRPGRRTGRRRRKRRRRGGQSSSPVRCGSRRQRRWPSRDTGPR